MKRILCLALLFAFVMTLTACGEQNAMSQQQEENADLTLAKVQSQEVQSPEIHAIACPDDYPTAQDEYGADAFGGVLNHPDSRYYVVNDFYHMESGDSLHILSGFETYQHNYRTSCV